MVLLLGIIIAAAAAVGVSSALSLASASLDLTSGYLSLEFSANVQSATLNASTIEILANSTNNLGWRRRYRLTGRIEGVFEDTNSSTTAYVMLLQDDYLNILFRDGLASAAANAYVQLDAGCVRGVAPATPSAAYGPALFDTYIADAYPPSIVKYAIDMNLGTLSVLFDEPVNRSTLDLSLVVIMSSSSTISSEATTTLTNDGLVLAPLPCHEVLVYSDAPTTAPSSTATRTTVAPTVVLVNATTTTTTTRVSSNATTTAKNTTSTDASPPDDAWVVCENRSKLEDSLWINATLGKTNADLIKSRSPLATTFALTYLAVTGGAVKDMAGNDLTTNFWTVYEGQPPYAWVGDATAPELETFDLDMNAGVLTLHFSETIDTSELKVYEMILQEKANASAGGLVHELRGGPGVGSRVIANEDVADVEIALSEADLNEIKRKSRLAIDISSTHIAFAGAKTFVDTAFPPNAGVQISTDSARGARAFTKDTTRPSLERFAVNLDAREIYLEFDETINASSLDMSMLVLQDERKFVATTTETFSLRRPDEPRGSKVTTPAATNLTISLGARDFAKIKLSETMGASTDTTYLAVVAGAIRDMADNLARERSVYNALAASHITLDATAPILEAVSLDMDRGILALAFDEPVARSSLDLSLLSIRGGETTDDVPEVAIGTLGSTTVAYADQTTETTSSSSSGNDDDRLWAAVVEQLALVDAPLSSTNAAEVLLVALEDADLNALKLVDGVADARETTYLQTSQAGWVADYFPENSAARAIDYAASNFTADRTKPKLASFELDLNTDSLTLVADEPLRSTSVNASYFELSSKPNGGGHVVRLTDLTGPSRRGLDGLRVRLEMYWAEIDAVKVDDALGSSIPQQKWLSHKLEFVVQGGGGGGGGASDMAGNPLAEIVAATNESIPCGRVVEDTTPPELLSFDLETTDYNLTLRFDEPVQPATLRGDGSWRLQRSRSADSGAAVELASLAAWGDDDWRRTIVARPSAAVRSTLSGRADLGRLQANTYLSVVGDDGVLDAARNGLLEIVDGLQLGPSVLSFELDMDSGELLLDLSEPIDMSSFDATGLVLQASEEYNENVDRLTLSSESAVTKVRGSRGASVRVALTADDVDEIRLYSDLSRGNASTWLVAASDATSDVDEGGISPNALVEAWSSSSGSAASLRAKVVYPDTTRPSLLSCTLDLNSDLMTLEFDEPVRAKSLEPRLVHLVLRGKEEARRTAAFSHSVALSEGSTARNDAATLYVDLSRLDSAKLKVGVGAAAAAAANTTTKWCAVDAHAVSDCGAGVSSSSSSSFEGAMSYAGVAKVAEITLDTTPPTLEKFVLDMDAGAILLTFDEPVNTSNVRPLEVAVSLADDQTSAAATYALACSSTTKTFGSFAFFDESATIELCDADSRAIASSAAKGGICADVARCYLFFGSRLAYDAADPPNAALSVDVEYGIQAAEIVADVTPPELVAIALDLNAGVLKLTADEIIDAKSVDVDAVTLQSARFNDGVATRTFKAERGTAVRKANERNATTIAIALGRDDLDAVKALSGVGLALAASSAYVSLRAGAFSDVFGNAAEAVEEFTGSGPAETFTPDATRPNLLAVTKISETRKILYALFDEPVDHERVNLSQWVLQPAATYEEATALALDGLGVNVLEPGIDADAPDPADPNAPYSTTVALQLSDAYEEAQSLGSLQSQDTARLSLGPFAARDAALADPNAVAGDVVDARNDYPNTGGARAVEVGPRLETFALDMDSHLLALSFTDFISTAPRNATTTTTTTRLLLDPTAVTLLSATGENAASAAAVMLSGSSVPVDAAVLGDADARLFATQLLDARGASLASADRRTVRVALSTSDAWALQRAAGLLAKAASTTYAAVTAAFGNSPSDTSLLGDPTSVVATSRDRAVALGEFVRDATAPRVESYALNLNSGVVSLNFSEPVVDKTINVTALKLLVAEDYSEEEEEETSVVRLQNAAADEDHVGLRATCDDARGNWSHACSYVRVVLGANDLDNVRAIRAGAFASFDETLASDTARPPNQCVPGTLAVGAFVKDTTRPSLEAVELNLDKGYMIMNFSEPVDPRSWNATRVYLRNNNNNNNVVESMDEHEPSGSPTTSVPNNSNSTTVLVLPTSTPTSTPLLSLRLSATGTTGTTTTGTRSLFLRLREDLARLKTLLALTTADARGIDVNTTYVDAKKDYVRDLAYPEPANPAKSVARRLDRVVPDTTGPRLLSFDANPDILEFYFDEPIDDATFNASALLLVGGGGGEENATTTTRLNLTRALTGDDAPYQLTVVATTAAERAALSSVVVAYDVIQLVHPAGGAASDVIGGTPAVPGAGPYGARLDHGEYVMDSLDGVSTGFAAAPLPFGPVVLSFVLDMDAGTLRLDFRHPIRSTTINATAVALAASDDDDSFAYALENATVVAVEKYSPDQGDASITLLLDVSDLDALKMADGGRGEAPIATRLTNVVAGVDATLAASTLGTPCVPRKIGAPSSYLSAVYPISFQPDVTAPTLLAFALSMDSGMLVLYADEPVRARETAVAKLVVYNNATIATATARYSLTEATKPLNPGASKTVDLKLGKADLVELKQLDGIATSRNDTYLGFGEDAILDRSAAANAFATGILHKVRFFYRDETPPELESFEADFEARTLSLYFDEPIRVASVNASAFVPRERNVGGQSYRLSGTGGVEPLPSGASSQTAVAISLSNEDYEAINILTRLAKNIDATRLAMESTAAEDVAGNPVERIFDGQTLAASSYIPDSTPPEMTHFWIDMDAGTITANFTEPVAFGTLDATRFVLAAKDNDDDLEAAVTPSEATRLLLLNVENDAAAAGTVLTLALDAGDLDAIKALPSLATSIESTYLVSLGGALADMTGNGLVATTLSCTFYSADITPPTLVAFDLDLDAGVLDLEFSETVDASTFKVEGIRLMAGTSFYRDGGRRLLVVDPLATLSPDTTTVSVSLGEEDWHAIKVLLAAETRAWLAMDAGTVLDMVGLPAVRVASADIFGQGEPMPARSVVPDTTPPVLERATYASRRLHLFYDEPVRTVVPELFFFSSSSDGTTGDVLLQGATHLVFFDLPEKTTAILEQHGVVVSAEAGAVFDVGGTPSREVVSFQLSGPACACADGYYVTAECTETEDAACSPCSSSSSSEAACPPNHFASSPCSDRADRGCQQCRECGYPYYAARACEETADTVCAECTACGPMEYEESPCAGGRDRVCVACDHDRECETPSEACEDAALWWRRAHCCFDDDGTQVPCNAEVRADARITARDSRRHWVYATYPEVEAGYTIDDVGG
ncbi:hypothetical protein CTAYLR_009992 [Chrysophaeum taylorii]|uniref:TNFR-Cys domain-containing protein n=1 Tax=Chrysophaeum taylorii TaxID=2483200 RepID=A0AAD7UBV3_9STRA|nr:hypothetical protein CTAYLR_009992 [Chrysophaeum taylorii]